jgi:inorganic pyrophosphatase
MRKLLFLVLTLAITLVISYDVKGQVGNIAPGLKATDRYTLVGEKNLLTGYQPKSPDGDINVVVEIPTGTVEKWEVTKPEGSLKWEFKKGKPRIVKYLGYPGNYGMIPRTLLPKELGGDGDPLDVIVLGPAVPRGSVVEAKLIGVLKLLDGGEQDDKLIAVLANTALYEAGNLKELKEKFRGVTTIVETWFINYKGPGELVSKGYGEVEEARKILDAAIKSFK